MENWYLVAGLGNPGAEYARTRHNAGFMLLDLLGAGWRVAWSAEKKFYGRVARTEQAGRKVVLCEPDTFMNASGESIGPLSAFYKIPPERILVCVDDADLPLGEIRLRPNGSSGGHHGLESVEHHLGSREFPRLRIGIGREDRSNRQIAGYVLSQFRPAELDLVEKVLQKASDQVECWLSAGAAQAMNKFNGAIKA